MPHILHNGQLLPDSAGVPVQNRGFLFADGIFETIRIAYGQPLFLEDHHQRIREGLKAHRIHAPLGFTPASIRGDIETLLEAEDITGGARVRITLTRSGAGFYTPEDSALDIIMMASPLETEAYVLNETGWSTDIYPEMKCTPNAPLPLQEHRLQPLRPERHLGPGQGIGHRPDPERPDGHH